MHVPPTQEAPDPFGQVVLHGALRPPLGARESASRTNMIESINLG